MTLTEEKRKSLKALYEVWGLDTVRREIERNALTGLTPPEVIEFARGWVAAEEAKSNRTSRRLRIALTVSLSLIGGTIAGLLIF